MIKRFFQTLIFFILLGTSPVFAQTNWNLSGGGDWFSGANWDNGVPNGGMDACIGADCDGIGPSLLTGTVSIQAPGASVNTVNILDGFTLQVNGTGTLDTTISAFVPGIMINNSSTFLVDGGGQATLGGVIMSGSATMTVDGAGSQIYVPVGSQGLNGVNGGFINVTNGGTFLSDNSGMYGQNGDTFTLAVSGLGSSFTHNADMYLGTNLGNALATVSFGAAMQTNLIIVGFLDAGTTALVVSESGTTLTDTSGIWVGWASASDNRLDVLNEAVVTTTGDIYAGYDYGSGDVNVFNSGSLSGANGYFGYDTTGMGADGDLIVDGGGTIFQLSGLLNVASGALGTGSVVVTDGATVIVTGAMNLATGNGFGGAGGTMDLTLSGATSSITASYIDAGNGTLGGTAIMDISEGDVTLDPGMFFSLYNGTLNLHHGGTLNGNLRIGGDPGGVATATIQSTSTLLNGSLNVSENGTVTASGGQIGGGAGSDISVSNGGSLTVTGANTEIDADFLQLSGNGTMVIEGGADAAFFGAGGTMFNMASNASLTVDGVGTTLSMDTFFGGAEIYRVSDGDILVQNGAVFSIEKGYGFVGFGATNVANLTVDGAGSRFEVNNGSLDLGAFAGEGFLNVTNGAEVYSGQGITAGSFFDDGAEGHILVDGTGSSITIGTGGVLYIAGGDDGDMTISDGGSVVASGITLIAGHYSAGHTGSILVTDAGSFLDTKELMVGRGAGSIATLRVENGAEMISAIAAIGTDGSTGSVEVTGAGSSWTVSGASSYTYYAPQPTTYTGLLTLSDGGVLNIGAAAADPAAAAGSFLSGGITTGTGHRYG